MTDYEVDEIALQRIQAFEHLFSILDGSDRDGAIDEARTWLSKQFGDNYFAVSRAFRTAQKVGLDEFPVELDA